MHLTTPRATQMLERVREGMAVMDATGEKIGKVDFVKMGDPDAATTQGQEPSPGGATGTGTGIPSLLAAPEAFAVGGLAGSGEPDVPDPRRSQLLRMGYIRVDRSGLFSGETYFAADEIASVDDDSVRVLPVGEHSTTDSTPHVAMPAPTGTTQRITVTPSAHTPPTTHAAPPTASAPVRPVVSETQPTEQEEGGWPVGRTLGGAALLGVALGGGAGYVRWRRERNRPLNRLRRRARALGKRLPDTSPITDRLPDVDRRVGSGLGAAVTGLALAWLLRGRGEEEEEVEQPVMVWETVPTTAASLMPVWWSVLGAALAAAVAVILWRRPREKKHPMYIGTPGVESALGRDRTRSGELPREMGVESAHKI